MSDDIRIYLLHFAEAVSSKRHYLGSARASQLVRRLRSHLLGTGARLTRRAVASQVPVTCVRVWIAETRELEFKLKRRSGFRRLCPICSPGVRIPINETPPVITTGGVAKQRTPALGW